jgi:hypothetical protein
LTQSIAFGLAGLLAIIVTAAANAAPAGYATVSGHAMPVPPGAKALGAVAASQQINLSIALPIRNEAALQGLI